MITVAVPHPKIADALGDLGEDARVIVWDPREGPAPDGERERITIACVPHSIHGGEAYGRLADCPTLQVIQLPSAGYEHAAPFVPAGKKLANARGVHDSRTAEMALALALASQRRLPRLWDAQRRGTWDPGGFSPSLADRRCLVIGYGSIGSALGARLRACEAEVVGVARSARTAPDGTEVHALDALPELLPAAEIVFLVTPLTEQTAGLVDASFLEALADGALIVNVGRGKVVDTDALLAELESGRLRAALDVTDPEPLPDGHPLWSAPGCIIVPHVAGNTKMTDRRYVDLVRRQVEAVRHGDDPVNFVTMGAFPA
ncbi:2-hydroxyacid dehydrogenase [Demequina sp. NBRC 110053]|uniref:2-hydroxyacid dehydrogenase n=1 Tax=Demequina sp. NBRC 110053 TaxID=1570342 RepID=UPI001F3C89A4|nr:2-hydroxyacid dehydrogenase [Demequina sp. NBRC 110053]